MLAQRRTKHTFAPVGQAGRRKERRADQGEGGERWKAERWVRRWKGRTGVTQREKKFSDRKDNRKIKIQGRRRRYSTRLHAH